MARVNEAALLGQLYNGDKYQGVTENRESGNYCFGNQHCASDGEKRCVHWYTQKLLTGAATPIFLRYRH